MQKVTRITEKLQRTALKVGKQSEIGEFQDMIENLLKDGAIELRDAGQRIRDFPFSITLAMFVKQVLSEDRSCQNIVNMMNAERLTRNEPCLSSHTGGYCRARMRLPANQIEVIAKMAGKKLCNSSPSEWLWRNRKVKLADGTGIALPDTEANQVQFPQHSKQMKGVGYPLARLVAITCLSTGALLEFSWAAHKGKGTGEITLLKSMLSCFEDGDVLIADACYASYFLIADLARYGVDILCRQGSSRKIDFRKGKKLGTKDHIVDWKKPAKPAWMTTKEYRTYPDLMPMREAKAGKHVIVTTLLNKEICKQELVEMYSARWSVELDLRSIKTILGMDVLRCRTPNMCEKEVLVFMLGYNLIRLLMAAAASDMGVLPRQLSFKHALQIWNALTTIASALKPEDTCSAELLKIVGQKRIGKRPGRIEPRVVKKRPKSYPKMKNTRAEERKKVMKQLRSKKMAA